MCNRAELESQPSAARNGYMAFSSLVSNSDVWSVTLNTEGGLPQQAPTRLTFDSAPDYCPTISTNGTRLVFLSNRSGDADLWERDLETGQERRVTTTSAAEMYPIFAKNAESVACARGERGTAGLYITDVRTGATTKIRDGWRRADDWSFDGRWILSSGQRAGEFRIEALSAETSEDREIMRNSEWELLSPRFSPDDKWIAFHVAKGSRLRQIFVVPNKRESILSSADWIAASDGSALDREPRWSLDGTLLYFVSERDGHLCIWAQRLNPTTKQRAGKPFAVCHLHDPRLANRMADTGQIGLAVTRDKIYLSLEQTTGSIWTASLN